VPHSTGWQVEDPAADVSPAGQALHEESALGAKKSVSQGWQDPCHESDAESKLSAESLSSCPAMQTQAGLPLALDGQLTVVQTGGTPDQEPNWHVWLCEPSFWKPVSQSHVITSP
jgi:hypothetical protein